MPKKAARVWEGSFISSLRRLEDEKGRHTERDEVHEERDGRGPLPSETETKLLEGRSGKSDREQKGDIDPKWHGG